MPRTLGTRAHGAMVAVLIASRREAGLTQEQLAERCKEAQSFVAMIENGQRRVDVQEFERIALALKIDPRKLFDRYLNWKK